MSTETSSRIALGAAAAVVLIAGVWYTATLRAQNAVLREQIAGYERIAAAAAEHGAAPTMAGAKSAPGGSAPVNLKPQRILSDEEREALRSELSAEPGKKVWFVREPNDPEAESFQRELEAVFQESGWEIADSTEAGFRIKAGLYLYIADSEPADHISAALNGLRAAGLQPFAGNGYRAFYERKKQEDPSFRGHEFAPEQDFVIVVGPNPDSAT